MFPRPIPISRPIRAFYLSRSLSFYAFCLFFTLFFSLLLPLSTPAHAFAANSPFTITSESATPTFGKEIDYHISVQDTNSALTQAILTVTLKGYYDSVQKFNVPVTTPSQNVQLSWQENISGDNFLYSGTSIIYEWQFQDSNANTYRGDYKNLSVIDNRFQWQQLSQGMLQVHWYNQDTGFGQIVLSQALDSIKSISSKLGNPPNAPINLWVYQTSDDFRGALPPGTYEWVGGLAYPPLNEAFIVVDNPNAETLVRDMPHELTHVVFHQLTEGVRIPTWFDEGLAVYNQKYHEPEMAQAFQDALTTHSLLRFDTLSDGFPADSNKAYLAYAESWKFVDYLYKTYGIAKMASFINGLKNDAGVFDAEVRQVFNEDSTHLENQWLISLHQPAILAPTQPTPQPSHKTLVPVVTTTDATAPWLISAGVFLILLALSGVTGLFVYQRRNAQLASQSVQVQPSQPVQHMPTQSAHTSQTHIRPTSDAFERYMPVEISHPEAPDDFGSYTEPSYYDASYKPMSQVEQAIDQTSLGSHLSVQHDVRLSEEEFPSFTFGQEYKIEQASNQQEETPYQTPQE